MANTEKPKSAAVRCPNIGGPLKSPRFVVVHYTASTNFRSTVDWLCNPKARASAHVVIDRDGSLQSLVPFDRIAWHAGPSAWKTYKGLNNFSIGIELLNAGPLNKAADGSFRTVVGAQLVEDVFEGNHKNNSVAYSFWQKYPEAQVQALDSLITQLFRDYPTLVEIVGHDDIAPARKTDPGPAFAEQMSLLQVRHNRY